MEKNHFCAWAIFSAFSHFCLLFLTGSKSEKCWSSQMIKVYQKKYPLFKIKNGFLAIFVILSKTRKWPKINFFLWKVEIFFTHKIQLGRPMFFIFYIFDSVKKSRQKWEKAEKMARAKKCPFSIFAHFFWPNQKCKNWKT